MMAADFWGLLINAIFSFGLGSVGLIQAKKYQRAKRKMKEIRNQSC